MAAFFVTIAIVPHSALAQQGGTIVWARYGDADTLDPQAATSTLSWQVYDQVYDTLLAFDMNGNIVPILAPYDPFKMGVGKKLQPPDAVHVLGTDEFGRDLFSRLAWGSRLTLQIGLVSVSISLVVGVTLGLSAGYLGGLSAILTMRAVDVLFSFTDTLIALAALAIFGTSLMSAMIAVGISAISFYARITYGVVLVEKNKQYFEAAYTIGASAWGLMFRHLLPNILSPLIVVATMGVSTAVLSAAGLSFLGLGAQPPSPEWGAVLASSRNYISRAPWLVVYPGLALTLIVLGFNLLGDGIREAIDPSQRRN